MTANSTTSSSFGMMDASKRERAISAAGREIEQALGLQRDTNVLARWMSFRLAEVREAVERAPDDEARRTAQAEQDQLIIALWAQRATLPVAVNADRRIAASLDLLEKLLKDEDHWFRSPPRPKGIGDILETLGEAKRRLVIAALAILYKRDAIGMEPEDPDLPLSDDDRKIREQFDELVVRALRHAEGGYRSSPRPADVDALPRLEAHARGQIAASRAALDALAAALNLKAAPPAKKPTRKKRAANS